MSDKICLNKQYSTTKMLQREKPLVKQEFYDQFESIFFLPKDDKGRKLEGGLRTKGYFKKSYEKKPLVTIVTVSYNSEQFLEETIKSIVQQGYDNIEYIIIDGASTDKTLEIIKKYEDVIDYFVSESDKGMYDALNKGFLLASGELINFCNSDDMFYADNTIEKIVEQYILENFDFCYGTAEFIDGKGKHLSFAYPLKFKKRYLVTLGLPFVQPTSFWTMNMMKKVGLFDLNYKIVSDYDLLSRVLLQSDNVRRISFPIIKFRKYGVSFGDKNTKKARQEAPVIRENCKKVLHMSELEDSLFSIYDRVYQKLNGIIKSFMENRK